jgi:release factor glutamine methyltransferase
MRKLLKRLAAIFLVPFFHWYLRKERTLQYHDIRIRVLPGVFHPGFFLSTKFLLEYVGEKDLTNKTFLELGSGTGLISVFAARKGAVVTASDVNATAVQNTALNARSNNVSIKTVHSDLFQSLTGTFDFIAINPPYYAKPVASDADHAWNAGEDHAYFRELFDRLSAHVHKDTEVVMVLTKGCNLEAIFEIAKESGFTPELIREKKVLFDEKDFLYRIRPLNSSALIQA